MNWLRGFAIAALTLALTACVKPTTRAPAVDASLAAAEAEKQRELVFEASVRDTLRLSTVGYFVRTRSAELCCEQVAPVTGINATTLAEFDAEYKAAAARLYGVGDDVQLISIVPGSAADRVGLQPGDKLVQIGGWPVPAGKGALVAAIEQFDAMAVAGSPLAFSVRRGGQTLTYDVVPEAACDYPVLLDNQDIVNAFADGDRIYITQGMLRFLDSSGELATVVAHELAHNMMGHRTAKQTNMVAGAGVGLVFDILAAVAGVNTGGDFMRIGAEAGAGAFSQDFEAEADYVGVYLMARGGYEISLAPNLWRRMAIIHPASIQTNHSSTHPSTPERFIALESAVKEIRAKLAAGLPLVPEVAVDTDGEGAESLPSTFRQE
jgi:hypothetical protein